MPERSNRSWVQDVRRLVVKIGSRLLVDQGGALDETRIVDLVRQMARLRKTGREVVCVSSGAIAAGLGPLGLATRPADLPGLQAAAAVGQARLMSLYRDAFAAEGLPVGQVLLSHADLRARDRHLNARNTFSRLLEGGAVPVVNENDTVAVDEIRFGDNDTLSALVAMLLRADLLVLLTTVEGLYSRPGAGGELIEVVEAVTDEVRAMAGGAGSALTVGGMQTKVEAASMVTRAGEWCVIADGGRPAVLVDLLRGVPIGTVFEPIQSRMGGRKRWIAFFDHPRGELHVDEGATRALREQGRSLLAIGMTAVGGSFERGAPVRILDPGGEEIGRGLVNYGSEDLRRVAGLRSAEFAAALGTCEYPEVVHRDNLVLR